VVSGIRNGASGAAMGCFCVFPCFRVSVFLCFTFLDWEWKPTDGTTRVSDAASDETEEKGKGGGECVVCPKRTSVKDSTAMSCLPASAEAFAALYTRSAETNVPSVSDASSVRVVGGRARQR
jgi:hypothetical protein